MHDVREIICITCPKGCEARVWMEEGSIKLKGKICKKGKAYLEQEFRDPRRVLTSTVIVEKSRVKRLPVRTAKGIPKTELLTAMEQLAGVRVRPPVRVGEVIIPNLLHTGVDLISCDDLRS